MKIKGFILEKEFHGREDLAISLYCNKYRLLFKKISYSKKSIPLIPYGYVPCGSVRWISQILGQKVKPNYYPEFLKEYLNRKIWESNKWPLGEKVFIKPSDVHKRFNGFITSGTHRKVEKPPYICSEIVSFENEWRYYIAHSKVIASEWYYGDEINEPDPPSISHIDFPENYFAAIDFGMVNGKMTLVEAHEPFSCGWYGKDHDKYVEWLSEGWFNRDKWLKDGRDSK